MIYYVYLIESIEFSKFYTGITSNLDRRLLEHNSGKSKYTSKFKPYRLVWSKEYFDLQDARNHEKWLKKKNNKYKIHLKHLND